MTGLAEGALEGYERVWRLARQLFTCSVMAARRTKSPTDTSNRKRETDWVPDRSVVLVGMMGVGKTTIGRRLAPHLGLRFKDADEEIEKAARMSVAELFRQHGEDSFRQGEAQVIERLLSGPPIVLATGGGALTTAATRRLIKEKALSVWLRADLDTIVERATRRPTRPLLKTGDPRATLERLLQERAPYYADADITVDGVKGPHAKTVDAILDAVDAYANREIA